MKLLTPLLAAALLWLVPAPAAVAQGFENKTVFTFDSPVQVPGAVLPAGEYVFELADPETPARAVIIRKRQGGEMLVTTVTLPIDRPEPDYADGIRVNFIETEGNEPPAIKAWFYPGDETGHVFVYPEEQARNIARDSKQLVLSSRDIEAKGELFLVDEKGERQAYQGSAQQAYLARKMPRMAAAAGEGGRPEAMGTSGRAEQHLDRIARAVQRMLTLTPQQETVGTTGSGSGKIAVSRGDLEEIQKQVEELRRELASSRPSARYDARQQQGQPQYQQTPPERKAEQQVGTAGAMATVEAIVDEPERFYGQTVTVSGDVGKVYGKRAFNIEEKGIVDVDDELLVLSRKDLANLTEDSTVQVRGKVQRFVKADLEREYDITDWNEFGLDEDSLSRYDTRPVLIADSVDVRQSGEQK